MKWIEKLKIALFVVAALATFNLTAWVFASTLAPAPFAYDTVVWGSAAVGIGCSLAGILVAGLELMLGL